MIYIMWEDVNELAVTGGAEGNRTPDPLLAKQVLSRLSYSPTLAIVGKRKAYVKVLGAKEP